MRKKDKREKEIEGRKNWKAGKKKKKNLLERFFSVTAYPKRISVFVKVGTSLDKALWYLIGSSSSTANYRWLWRCTFLRSASLFWIASLFFFFFFLGHPFLSAFSLLRFIRWKSNGVQLKASVLHNASFPLIPSSAEEEKVSTIVA